MTRKRQIYLGILGLLFLVNLVVLAYRRGRSSGESSTRSLEAAKSAARLSEVLGRIDKVERYDLYRSLDFWLDNCIVDAGRWDYWEREEVGKRLYKVAQYRDAHPRWRPDSAELARAKAGHARTARPSSAPSLLSCGPLSEASSWTTRSWTAM